MPKSDILVQSYYSTLQKATTPNSTNFMSIVNYVETSYVLLPSLHLSS